jgi:hypothetical protein
MAARVKKDAKAPKLKQRYRVTNWAEYDRSLVSRGSLTVWFDQASVREGWVPAKTGRRGAPAAYSDLAIQTVLTLKVLFHLPYRAVEGLVKSLMRLTGLNLPVPDHTHLSRRAATLSVRIPRRRRNAPMHVVVDSTGLKIYGEGEWKVRAHGVGKRRTWRKVHLAVDESVKDVVAVEVTTTEWADCELFDDLMGQIDEPIAQVSADGAYDTEAVHASALALEAKATIPPREGAAPWGDGHPRDAILDQIDALGRPGWKKACGYHRRSIAENMMGRFKRFGERLFSRALPTQTVESQVRVALLNGFTYLGMPTSVSMGVIAPAI